MNVQRVSRSRPRFSDLSISCFTPTVRTPSENGDTLMQGAGSLDVKDTKDCFVSIQIVKNEQTMSFLAFFLYLLFSLDL